MDRNIGKKLDGRYEVTELIGIGGMADVYKAIDIIDDKIVAVKILKNEFSNDEDFLRRFRNESKAIAVLSHPNIVKIYDVGFTDKIQFIVMEFIDGITLKEFIDQQGILKWKDAIHFIIQILRALQHAHDRGIVHRDIKPQNIMLFPDGTIKVMDFGIARFAREEGKTLSDKAIGSVHYISPEQARGDITDEKSDIYSVGIMLYEMLTGQKPFDADNPVSVALMHMQTRAKNPRDINETIPEGLEEIVLRAIQKDAAKRYQSASAMIKDIEEFKRNPSIIFEYKYLSPEADSSTRYFEPIIEKQSKRDVQKRKPLYDEDEDDEEEESGKSLFVPILAAVSAAVLIIACFFIVTVLLNQLGGNNAPTSMPDLIGTSFVEADAKYKASDAPLKLNLKVEAEDWSELDKGLIYYQGKNAGDEVKSGATIQVKVSKGKRMVTIPDIVGNESAQGINALEQLGLVGEPRNIVNASPKGFVIKTEPVTSTQVAPGSTVLVFVSLGPELEEVIVPSFLDKTKEDAERLAAVKKLKLEYTEGTSDKPADTVIDQDIKTGETVMQDSVVTLTLSTGIAVIKKWGLPVPVTVGTTGAYEFRAYVDGNLVGTTKKDNLSGLTSIVIECESSGQRTVMIEIINTNTNVIKQLGQYTMDFTTGTFAEVSYDPYAFGDTATGTTAVTVPTEAVTF